MSELSRYTCEEVFRRLDDFLDRELGPEETALVEEHLRHCATCLSEYRFERSVVDNLRRKVDQIRPPAGLKDAIFSALRQEE